VFAVIALFIIVWLHPTLSAIAFPFKRQIMLNTMLTKIDKDKKIDAQEFWQFREFYYPGAISFNRTGLAEQSPYTFDPLLKPFLFTSFHSKYISSYEYLVTMNDLNYVVPFNEDWKLYLESSVAVRKRNNTVDIVFIKPVSEMVKANGFLDYKDKDKKLLEAKFWLVFSQIKK
jgi:hypothetical protein